MATLCYVLLVLVPPLHLVIATRHLRTVQLYDFLVLNSRIIEFWIFTLKWCPK